MDNIVMAPLAGVPVTDAAAAAVAGPDAGADGGFGSVFGAELDALAGTGKGGKNSEAENPGETLAAMLLASFMGLRVNAQDISEAVESTGTVEPAGTQDVTGTVSAAQKPADDAGGNNGIGALMRLFAGNREAREALKALAGNGGALKELMQAATHTDGRKFSELISALKAGTGGNETAGTVSDGEGANAVKEIRQLFAELIAAAEPKAETPAAEAGAAATENPAATLEMNRIREILDRIEQVVSGGEDAAAPAERPVVTIAVETGSTDGGETGDETGTSAKTAEAGAADGATGVKTKKEPLDFASALRAYRGDATGRPAQASAPAENSAAIALRQGGKAFDAIVDKISTMQTAGQKELEIRLKPDFLGNVVIKLSMGEGGLTASIAASNPKVQDAFLSQASALQNSLMEQGIKDVRVVVTSSSVQDASLQQQQSQGRGQNGQQRQKRHAPAITELGGVPAAQPLLVYEQAYRSGQINRLA